VNRLATEAVLTKGRNFSEPKTLRLTLSQDVDVNGDVDVDSILDLARRPSVILHILDEDYRTDRQRSRSTIGSKSTSPSMSKEGSTSRSWVG
jgi:hypothetical protein